MMKQTMWLLSIGLIAMVIVACVPVTPAPTSDGASMDAEKPAEDALTSNATVNQAMQDLATQLDVALAEVAVVSVEDVTWSDSALGCPEPDYMYMQVLQEGMRIRLQVSDTIYQYHSGGTEPPALCENPNEPVDAETTPGF